jgi:tRNA A37 threonylcarbamoyladenosine modification protein TsaB
MYLILDPSSADKVGLYFWHQGSWNYYEQADERSGAYLRVLVGFLNTHHLQLADIEGCAVVVGKGRFTSTRVAVTLANILSFAKGIQVCALTEIPPRLPPERLFTRAQSSYVLPVYSGEPRIHRSASL